MTGIPGGVDGAEDGKVDKGAADAGFGEMTGSPGGVDGAEDGKVDNGAGGTGFGEMTGSPGGVDGAEDGKVDNGAGGAGFGEMTGSPGGVVGAEDGKLDKGADRPLALPVPVTVLVRLGKPRTGKPGAGGGTCALALAPMSSVTKRTSLVFTKKFIWRPV